MSKINNRTRKKHSGEVKFQVVMEVLTKPRSQAEIARSYGIHYNLITAWKNQFLKNGSKIFEADNAKTDKAKDKKISELENIIGKQTVEISLLKKFLGHYRSG